MNSRFWQPWQNRCPLSVEGPHHDDPETTGLSGERKRFSLWKVDPDALSVSFVLGLPSRGDTCFAPALGAGEHEMTVYNYTSPLDSEDLDWFRAQGGPTIIGRR